MKQHIKSVRHQVRLKDTKKDKDEIENFFQRVLSDAENTDGSNVRDEDDVSQEQTAQYLQNNKEELKKFLEWRKMQKAMEKGHSSEKLSPELVGVTTKQDEGDISDRMEGIEASSTNIPPFKSKDLPNPKKEVQRARPKVDKDNRIRMERSWKFISEATYNFYLQGEFNQFI